MTIDKDLIKLYNIHSVSGTDGEKEICDWLCKRLDELKVKYTRLNNNIYKFTQYNEVLLSAHLDQVHTNGRAEHFYLLDKRYIVGYNNKYQRTSLGADDKNGVWIILKLLEQGVPVDFIISSSEEIGCKGIAEVEPRLTEHIKKRPYDYHYCIVLDRRGNKDILNRGSTGKYCDALATNLKNFWDKGYSVGSGSVSDTATICKYIESVNMSVAYENPHTANEKTDYTALTNILKDVKEAIEDFVHYPAVPDDYITVRASVSTYKYNRGEYLNDWI